MNTQDATSDALPKNDRALAWGPWFAAMTTKKDIEEEVSSEDSDEDMPDLEVRDLPEPEDAQRKAIWTGWRFWELSSS